MLLILLCRDYYAIIFNGNILCNLPTQKDYLLWIFRFYYFFPKKLLLIHIVLCNLPGESFMKVLFLSKHFTVSPSGNFCGMKTKIANLLSNMGWVLRSWPYCFNRNKEKMWSFFVALNICLSFVFLLQESLQRLVHRKLTYDWQVLD